MDDYLDNVSGVSRRRKSRLRWYGDASETLVLEFKIKWNRASRKVVVPLRNESGQPPDSTKAVARLIEENSDCGEMKSLIGLRPILEAP